MNEIKPVKCRLDANSADIKYLEWDSGIFGFKIGRLGNIRLDKNEKTAGRFINRIIKSCRKQHYRHINCRIGTGDFLALWALEKNGFNVADIQVTLSTGGKPKKKTVKLPGFSVVKACEDDLDGMRCVTRDAFTDTRVVRDPNYPRVKVDRFYYEWIKNSMFNKRQAVFLAKENKSKELAGFVICDVLGEIGFIDLISVNKRKRGRGIGSALVGAAMNWFSDNSVEAEVRTQASNTAAIETFTKGGFRHLVPGKAVPSGISMHYWFTKG